MDNFYQHLSDEKIAQAKAQQVKRLRAMPTLTPDKAIYDPDYHPAPLVFDGLATGVPSLDSWLLGMRKKDIVLFGAQTDLGKTMFALFVALNIAAQGKRVVYMAAEDDIDWVTEAYNKIVKNNNLQESVGNVSFIAEEEALKFVGKKDNVKLLIDTLKADGVCDWLFVDMLNNISDPLEDKAINNFLTELRQHANMYGYSVWFNCRFREIDRGQSVPRQAQERFSPPDSMFYGRGGYRYNATKVLALSEYEGDGGDNFVKAIKIMKGKRSKPGYKKWRHLVTWGEDLVFSQPEDPVVSSLVDLGMCDDKR